MPSYGKYYIGIRLLLLKEYLQANAGKDRIVKRKDLQAYLTEPGFPVEKKTLYADFAVLDDVFGLQVKTSLLLFVDVKRCAKLFASRKTRL